MSSTNDTSAFEKAALALALKKIATEAPGIRVVPEHAAKEVAPGHRVKLELSQFDRFAKDLFHYVTPFSVHERSRCRTLSPAKAPSRRRGCREEAP